MRKRDITHRFLLILWLLFATVAPCAMAQTAGVIYVSNRTNQQLGIAEDAERDGHDWRHAMESLQTAIDLAKNNRKQVWVQGHHNPDAPLFYYYPSSVITDEYGTVGTTNRWKSFIMQKGVQVYGGFQGFVLAGDSVYNNAGELVKSSVNVAGETSLAQRRFLTPAGAVTTTKQGAQPWRFLYQTVLSGDVDGGATGRLEGSDSYTNGWQWNSNKSLWDCNYRMNSFHVVWFCSGGFYPVSVINRVPVAKPMTESTLADSLSVLDGFCIVGGQSNIGSSVNVNTVGAGVFMTQGSVVRNCVIMENYARFRGAGVEMNNGGTLQDCLVARNSAPGLQSIQAKGGGIHVLLRGKIENVVVVDNSAHTGAGIFVEDGRNNSNVPSALLAARNPWDIQISNVTVSNNTASKEAGGIYFDGAGTLSVATVANNLCSATTGDNQGRTGGLFVKNYGVVVNSAFWGNMADDGDNTSQFYSAGTGNKTNDLICVYNSSLQDISSTEWGAGTALQNVYNISPYNTASDDPSVSTSSVEYPKFTNAARVAVKGVYHPSLTNDVAGITAKKSYLSTTANIYWKIGENSTLLAKGSVSAESPYIDAAQSSRLSIASTDIFGTSFVEPRPVGAYMGNIIALRPVLISDPNIRDANGNASSQQVWALFVDPDAIQNGDGSSWEQATNQIYDALDALVAKRNATESTTSPSNYYVVYIKEGTIIPNIVPDIMKSYNPTLWNDADRRSCTLPLYSRLIIRGSYLSTATGTQVANSYRDPVNHRTVLSGDRGETGTTAGTAAFDDNLYHVVTAADNSYPGSDGKSFTAITGCHIVYGNATGSDPTATLTRGAGIETMNNVDLIVHSCIIENCEAAQGAAVYGDATTNVTIASCAINNNTSTRATEKSTVEVEGHLALVNSTLAHNAGSAIALQEKNLVVNSLFFENSNGPFSIDPAIDVANLTSLWIYNAFDTDESKFWDATGTSDYKPKAVLNNILITDISKDNFTNSTNITGCVEVGIDTRNGGDAIWEPCNNGTVMNLAINNGCSLQDARTFLATYAPAYVPMLSPKNILDLDLRFNTYNHGGASDVGALESTVLPRSGVIYVSKYGAGDMDGSSWQNAIAGNVVYDITTGRPVVPSGTDTVKTTDTRYTTLNQTYAEQSSARFSAAFWSCAGNTLRNGAGSNVISNNRDQRYVSGLQYAVEKGSADTKADKVMRQVWVAAGTYTDIKGFVIRDSVEVYGGFPITNVTTGAVNGSPTMDERHALLAAGIPPRDEDVALTPNLYETILQVSETAPVTWNYLSGFYQPTVNTSLPSGYRRSVLYQPDACMPTWSPNDANNSDEPSNADRFPASNGDKIDNTNYVEYGHAQWDGFTLRHGYLTGIRANRDGGAGLRVFRGTTVRNCVVRDNYNNGTRNRGGGVYFDGKTSAFSNCFLLFNYADGNEAYGGGMYMIRGTGFNLAVANNFSYVYGGGIFIEDATFYNNTVAFNYARTEGGGLYQWTGSSANSTLDVFNCIFYGNNKRAIASSNEEYVKSFYNCFVQTETALSSIVSGKITAANGNITGTGTALASPFKNSSAQTENNYRIVNSSLCFNAGLNTPNNATLPATDLDFSDRIKDCTVDIGAFESSDANPIIPTIVQWDRDGDGTDENIVVFYVSEDGNGAASGRNWDNAACECKLQDLLNYVHYYRMGKHRTPASPTFEAYASASASATTTTTYNLDDYPYFEVWIAKGDYLPQHRMLKGYPRSYSWVVAPGITVRGGFAGISMDERPDTRDVKNNATLFSGKINSDTPDNSSTYAYSVLHLGMGPDIDQNPANIDKENGVAYYADRSNEVGYYGRAVVNGITVAYGNADHPTDEKLQSGGGVNIYAGGRLENSIVRDNQSINRGGGINIESGGLATGCLVRDNLAKFGGGVFLENGSNLYASTVVMNRTTESGNGGGLYYNSTSTRPTVRSTAVWKNESNNGKNIFGNVSGVQSGYVFGYNAIEAVCPAGVGNLKLSSVNDVENRTSNNNVYYPDFNDVDADDYTIYIRSDLYRSGEYIYDNNRTTPPNDNYTEADMYNVNRFMEGNDPVNLEERKGSSDGRFEIGAYAVEELSDPWPTEYNGNSGNVFRLYVSQNRKGSSNGHTWRNSMNDLQKALDYFADDSNFPHNPDRRCEIWMSEGEYQPTKILNKANCGNEEFMASFDLNPYTNIYGGFRGSNAFYYESVIEDYQYEDDGRLQVTGTNNMGVRFESRITVNAADPSTCFLHILASRELTISDVKLYNGGTLVRGNCQNDIHWEGQEMGTDTLFISYPFYDDGNYTLNGRQIDSVAFTVSGTGWIDYVSIDNRVNYNTLCKSLTYVAPTDVSRVEKVYSTDELYTGENELSQREHLDYNTNRLKEDWSFEHETVLDGKLSGSETDKNFHVMHYNVDDYKSTTIQIYDTTYQAQRYVIGTRVTSLTAGTDYIVSISQLNTSSISATCLGYVNGNTKFTNPSVALNGGQIKVADITPVLLTAVSNGSYYSIRHKESGNYLHYSVTYSYYLGYYRTITNINTTRTLDVATSASANVYNTTGSPDRYVTLTFTTSGTDFSFSSNRLSTLYYYSDWTYSRRWTETERTGTGYLYYSNSTWDLNTSGTTLYFYPVTLQTVTANKNDADAEMVLTPAGTITKTNALVDSTICINGVTVQNGSATEGCGEHIDNLRGGGLWSNGNVELQYCNFVNNEAAWGGGAIYSEGTNLVVTSSQMMANGTTGSNGKGGAVYARANNEKGRNATSFFTVNSIYSNNESAGDGTAIYTADSVKTVIMNCTLARNLWTAEPASDDGGDGTGAGGTTKYKAVAHTENYNHTTYSNATDVIADADKGNFIINSVFWGNNLQTRESRKREHMNMTPDPWFIYSSAGDLEDVKYSNTVALTRENSDIQGPRFGNPSAQSGRQGYTNDMDYSLHSKCILVNAGTQDGARGLTTVYRTQNGHIEGPFYSMEKMDTVVTVYHDNTPADSLMCYYYFQKYFGEVADFPNSIHGGWRISPEVKDYYIYNDVQNGEQVYSTGVAAWKEGVIDIGAYEYQNTELKPFAGNIVYVTSDEDVENPEDNDGSTWMKATSDINEAIRMLMTNANNKNKYIKVASGSYVPTDPSKGYSFCIKNPKDAIDTLHSVARPIITSLTIRGAYPDIVIGNDTIMEMYNNILETPTVIHGYNNRRSKHLFYVDISMDSMNAKPGTSHDLGNVSPIRFERLEFCYGNIAADGIAGIDTPDDGAAICALNRNTIIRHCRFYDNYNSDPANVDTERKAGAVYLLGGKIVNSLFYNNSLWGLHKMVCFPDTVANNTFALNSGGGILINIDNVLSDDNVKPAFLNNVLWGNGPGMEYNAAKDQMRFTTTPASNSEVFARQMDLEGYDIVEKILAPDSLFFRKISVWNTAIMGWDDVTHHVPAAQQDSTGVERFYVGFVSPHNGVRLISPQNKDLAYGPLFKDVASRKYELNPGVQLLNSGLQITNDPMNMAKSGAMRSFFTGLDEFVDTLPGNADISDIAYRNLFETYHTGHYSQFSYVVNGDSQSSYEEGSDYFYDAFTNDRISADVIDIGAFEYANIFYPNIFVAENGIGRGSSWNDPTGDLKGAILSAYYARNGNARGSVWVKGGNYSLTDYNTSSEDLIWRQGVSVYGSFNGYEKYLTSRPNILERNTILSEINMNGRSLNTMNDKVAQKDTLVWGVFDGFVLKDNVATTHDTVAITLGKAFAMANCAIEKISSDTAVVKMNDGALLYNTLIKEVTVPAAIPWVVAQDTTQAGAAERDMVIKNKMSSNAIVNVTFVQPVQNAFKSNIVIDENAGSTTHRKLFVANTVGIGAASYSLSDETVMDNYSPFAVNYSGDDRLKYQLNEIALFGADNANDYYVGQANEYLYESGHLWQRIVKNEGQADEESYYVPEIIRTQDPMQKIFYRYSLIDFANDKDLMGNRRVFAQAYRSTGAKSAPSYGCFEPFFVNASSTLLLDSIYNPVEGTVAYVDTAATLTLKRYASGSSMTFAPEYLLLRDKAQIVGNGNNINLEKVSVEYVMRRGKWSLTSMPFDYLTGSGSWTTGVTATLRPDIKHLNLTPLTLGTDEPTSTNHKIEQYRYDGEERGAMRYKSYEDDSPYWVALPTDTAKACMGYLMRHAATDTLLRFSASSERHFSYVYSEAGDDYKTVTLQQYNLIDKSGTANFTYKENMGWNLVGNPYLANYPWKKMELPHTYYSYDNDNHTYNVVQSWNNNGYTALGAAFFTQTATLKESEPLYLEQLESSEAGRINAVREASGDAVRMRIRGEGGSQSDQVTIVPVEGVENALAFDMSGDALKWMGMDEVTPQIYVNNSENVRLALTNSADLQGSTPIGVTTRCAGRYNIELDRDFATDYDMVLLVDSKLNLVQNLHEGGYSFSVEEGNEGDMNGRFMLRFARDGGGDAGETGELPYLYQKREGLLGVAGLTEGEQIIVYDANGRLWSSIFADDSVAEIPLQPQIYVVTVLRGDKRVMSGKIKLK